MKIKIISDIHLGISNSNDFLLDKNDFLITLKKLSNENDYLILLGDVFECWESDFESQEQRFCRIKHEYSEIINFIEETNNVILISGNHDVIVWQKKLIKKVKRFFKIEGKYNLYFAHGHQADLFNYNFSWIGRTITRFVGLAENYIDPNIDVSLSKLLSTFDKHSDNNTMEHGFCVGFDYNCDLVVYGHTHSPMLFLGDVNYKKIIYANSGSVAYKKDLIDMIDICCDTNLTVSYVLYSVKQNQICIIKKQETIIK
jgi:UDP-2,3-diacylglucosamine pyrophosphatase LpxH